MNKSLNDIVNQWLIKAENDLKTAEFCFNAEEKITDTICFHCQQVVEKLLKAFLVNNGIPPEKTHKIEVLLDLCCKIDKSFLELEEIVLLTEYSVELRYPDDFYMPSVEEAETALSLAKKTKSFILNKLI